MTDISSYALMGRKLGKKFTPLHDAGGLSASESERYKREANELKRRTKNVDIERRALLKARGEEVPE